MPQSVSDLASNAQENIAHAAGIIGRSGHRRDVFNAIYTGKRRLKRVRELMQSTGLPRIRVLDAGKKLADNKIVEQKRINGETAYEKIDFFHAHKRRILALADSPAKLRVYPTKRNTRTGASIQLAISRQRATVVQITLDDIQSFRRAWNTTSQTFVGDRLSESAFKRGIQKIIGEGGEFKDWGGEISDLFTTRLRLAERRRPAAIALKGRATKGKLTPGKMGKNGDQIQRLFSAPADIYLIQYCRQIDESVLTQMEKLAVAKSVLSSIPVWYGVIDGQDSDRLVKAYPRAFRAL